MTPPRSPLTLALERILADGAWHDIDDVRAQLVALVPPGRAYRRSEADRTAKAAGATRIKGDRATAVAAGARDIATDAIASGVRYGRIERDGDAIRTIRGDDRA